MSPGPAWATDGVLPHKSEKLKGELWLQYAQGLLNSVWVTVRRDEGVVPRRPHTFL